MNMHDVSFPPAAFIESRTYPRAWPETVLPVERSSDDKRLRTWLLTGDPGHLWPHVTPASRREAHRRVAAVTRAVINRTPLPGRLEADGDVPVAAWGVAAYTSGMGPLLGHWIAQRVVEADTQLADLFREHLEHGHRRAAKITTAMRQVIDACGHLGVTPTVLKGAHTAQVYFPDVATRPSADIDVLVHPSAFGRACAALETAGFTEARRTSRPPRSEWIRRDSSPMIHSLELDHAENPWSIDLHQSLERWYFRGLRGGFEPALWTTVPLELANVRVQGLAQPLLTAFLAMHAAFGVRDLRLLHLVELVWIIRRDVASGSLQWRDLTELLTKTRTARFAYPALELAERLAPGTIDPDTRGQLAGTGTARMRRVIDAISTAGMQLPRRTLDERLMWACGVRELLCNIGELVWPSDEALPAAEVARLYLRRARLLVRGRIGIRSQAR